MLQSILNNDSNFKISASTGYRIMSQNLKRLNRDVRPDTGGLIYSQTLLRMFL